MPHALPQASGNPCFLDYTYPSFCLRYHGVGDGRRLLKVGVGWIRRTVPLGATERLRWILSMLFIAYCNKRNVVLFPKLTMSMHKIMFYFIYECHFDVWSIICLYDIKSILWIWFTSILLCMFELNDFQVWRTSGVAKGLNPVGPTRTKEIWVRSVLCSLII